MDSGHRQKTSGPPGTLQAFCTNFSTAEKSASRNEHLSVCCQPLPHAPSYYWTGRQSVPTVQTILVALSPREPCLMCLGCALSE